jgi:hypothetical protein
MLSVTERSYSATILVRNSAWRRSSSRMSARVCGAWTQIMQSAQRSSTSTTSAPFASQRNGCRNEDPHLGHSVSAATSAKLRRGPDGMGPGLCVSYQVADYPGRVTIMDAHEEPPSEPQDTTQNERRLAGLGMTPEVAKAYAAFHAGMRWPRPSDFL